MSKRLTKSVLTMAGIKQNGILGQLLRDSWLASAEHLVQDCFMRIDMTDEERDILIRWKKRSDTYRLVRIEGGGDCVRCPWRRPGYCRGDGRAGRGDGTRVAVGMAEMQAGPSW